jgi:hypothetical protein
MAHGSWLAHAVRIGELVQPADNPTRAAPVIALPAQL